jgi:site-specific DNA recombinase
VSAMIPFAFWGRVSTEDNHDPESSRGWQLTRARALIEPHGGQITVEFFDIDKSRWIPPQRRPQASRLLAALSDPRRGFDAVVVGEPQRAFYGSQFGNTFPLFAHWGVPLWVPEVGGAIDPDNEAHDLIMSVFGGVSKGERNRIRIRVRTAMAAQAQIESRFLGGRPPYGYVLIDIGPHPNPAKAADGKRLHALAIDQQAAAVVQRIFAEFISGLGLQAIAEGLTRDGTRCPSAHDRARNQHRSGIAWSKGAIRAILTNPRYTGRQVWNRQRTDEVLLDPADVSLGHTEKMRWNPADKWIWSAEAAHPEIIHQDTFDQAQQIMLFRGRGPCQHTPHRVRRPYQLRGLLFCGYCDRRMQGEWNNQAPYYRCRYPLEYALAGKISHPRNVYVREDAIVPELDRWLIRKFTPGNLPQLIDELFLAQDTGHDTGAADAQQKIAECDRKLNAHRAALEALPDGADPSIIAGWIAQTQAERAAAQAELQRASRRARLTREGIQTLIDQAGDILAALRHADADDKTEIYKHLGVKLTYRPQEQVVRAEARLAAASIGERSVSEGGLEQRISVRFPRIGEIMQ